MPSLSMQNLGRLLLLSVFVLLWPIETLAAPAQVSLTIAPLSHTPTLMLSLTATNTLKQVVHLPLLSAGDNRLSVVKPDGVEVQNGLKRNNRHVITLKPDESTTFTASIEALFSYCGIKALGTYIVRWRLLDQSRDITIIRTKNAIVIKKL